MTEKTANHQHTRLYICILTAIILAAVLFALPTFGKTKDPMTVTVKTVNKWNQGKETYVQMSVILQNPQSAKITSWNLKLNFDRNIKLVNSWCGTYSISGRVSTSEGDKWISFLKNNHISYVCRNLSNKNETSALLKSSCTKTSGFTDNDLTAQGKWFVNK